MKMLRSRRRFGHGQLDVGSVPVRFAASAGCCLCLDVVLDRFRYLSSTWIALGVEKSEKMARPNSRLFSLHACRVEIDRNMVQCPFLNGLEGIEQESKEGEEAT